MNRCTFVKFLILSVVNAMFMAGLYFCCAISVDYCYCVSFCHYLHTVLFCFVDLDHAYL